MKVGPFFIGGTGRSGTSQLARVLGEHPLVHSLGVETRFLIDPGGLEELAEALTTGYTHRRAEDALRRLSFLLNVRLLGLAQDTFRGYNLAASFPRDVYREGVDDLIQRLVWYEYQEVIPGISRRRLLRQLMRGLPGGQNGLTNASVSRHRLLSELARQPFGRSAEVTNLRSIPRFFSDRAELIAILRDFVDGLFSQAADGEGKSTWCEKTPFNVLSTSFLWELFPRSTIIIIVRHPYRVLSSHVAQPFLPSSLDDAVSMLQPIYARWLQQRGRLLRDPRYIEVKLEDLSANWPDSRRLLFDRLGLGDFRTRSEFKEEAVRHRDNTFEPSEIAMIDRRLGSVISALGY